MKSIVHVWLHGTPWCTPWCMVNRGNMFKQVPAQAAVSASKTLLMRNQERLHDDHSIRPDHGWPCRAWLFCQEDARYKGGPTSVVVFGCGRVPTGEVDAEGSRNPASSVPLAREYSGCENDGLLYISADAVHRFTISCVCGQASRQTNFDLKHVLKNGILCVRCARGRRVDIGRQPDSGDIPLTFGLWSSESERMPRRRRAGQDNCTAPPFRTQNMWLALFVLFLN
jgi:hypothetical protein